MIYKVLIATGAAFGASALLYEKLHAPAIPELARYGVGGLTIILVALLLFGEDTALKVAVAVSAAGVGVTLNRLRMAIE